MDRTTSSAELPTHSNRVRSSLRKADSGRQVREESGITSHIVGVNESDEAIRGAGAGTADFRLHTKQTSLGSVTQISQRHENRSVSAGELLRVIRGTGCSSGSALTVS